MLFFNLYPHQKEESKSKIRDTLEKSFHFLERSFHNIPNIKTITFHRLKSLEVGEMKKIVGIAILLLVFVSIFGGILTTSVLADENYMDNSNEYSNGPGEAPEDGMSREEPRTRFKDS
jgi:hypothetical protein